MAGAGGLPNGDVGGGVDIANLVRHAESLYLHCEALELEIASVRLHAAALKHQLERLRGPETAPTRPAVRREPEEPEFYEHRPVNGPRGTRTVRPR
jgi:hypothetical protein